MVKVYTLSRPQRAAAILVAMGKERAGVVLKTFKSDELRVMIDAAHTLQTIPQPDLEKLVQEFEAEFTKGVGLIDSADTMKNILNDFMSDDELKDFIKREQMDNSEKDTIDIWEQLEETEPEKVVAYLEKQPAQLASIILKRLQPKTSASLLKQLPEDKRKKTVARMLSSRDISDRMLEAIEKNLREEFKPNPNAGGMRESASKMADILNEMDSETCDIMLAQMEGQIDDKKLALVKSMMFRFEDVVRMATEDRTKLCDGLPQELLTNALYKADKSVMEAVLSSLGQRTRRMIESEISDDVKIQENTVLQARKSIATLALKMAAEGQITLPEK